MHNRPYKILVTGAFSTGKTTLLAETTRALTTQRFKVHLVNDVARNCPYPLNRQQTLPVSIWLLAEQVRCEAAPLIEGNYDVLLCDRGVPDIVSHTLALSEKTTNARLNSIFMDFARIWSRTYDWVLWSKRDPSLPIGEDGLRVNDSHYQELMERSLLNALDLLNLNFDTLPPGQQERCTLLTSRLTLFAKSTSTDP